MFHRSERLLLRPPWPEDWQAVHAGIADEGVVRNLARAPWPYAEEDARDDVRYGLKQALTRWQRRLEVLQLAENRMRLAMDKLEVEQEKYKSGLSTLANVVLFQRDLDSARQGLQTARYDVILATARHHQLQGTLAASAGVEVD